MDGYFEETKLARLSVGDRAEVKLMGYSDPIIRHIATVTRGVSVSNAAAAIQGLPNVDPVYTWVRLAQRVPVRIGIDQVPLWCPTGIWVDGDRHDPGRQGRRELEHSCKEFAPNSK